MPNWEYFLAIEQDLDKCTRYVQFCQQNYKTYSLEFARIIVASGAECDTIMKLLCRSIGSSRVPEKIGECFPIVNSAYPKFVEHEIRIPRYGLSFTPWGTWSSTNSPDWWKNGYNKIKHERDTSFENANLENAIMATAGLLCTLLYYYEELRLKQSIPLHIDFSQSPRLLSPRHYGPWQDAEITWGYDLPQ
jgi:hypothetical protein